MRHRYANCTRRVVGNALVERGKLHTRLLQRILTCRRLNLRVDNRIIRVFANIDYVKYQRIIISVTGSQHSFRVKKLIFCEFINVIVDDLIL